MTAVTFALLIGAVPLQKLAHQAVNPGNLLMLPFALVGAVVAIRQPRNPIGWIMLALAMLFLTAPTPACMPYSPSRRPFGAAACTARRRLHPAVGRAARALAAADPAVPRRSLAVEALALAVLRLRRSVRLARDRNRDQRCGRLHRQEHPGRFLGRARESRWQLTSGGRVRACCSPSTPGSRSSFVFAQLLAYRRSTGDRREQLKWLMSGSAIGIIGLAIALSPDQQDSRQRRLAWASSPSH